MSFKTLRRRKPREMGEAIFHFSGTEIFSFCFTHLFLPGLNSDINNIIEYCSVFLLCFFRGNISMVVSNDSTR